MTHVSSYRDALAEALDTAALKHENMVVMTPDLAKSVRIFGFKEKYPDRFVSVGISEANNISVAAGLSTVGYIPVVAAFVMFAVEKPFEQIRNSIAYPNLNVKIVATHGGLCVGMDGATHQALEDIAMMRALPNMSVLVPCDASETIAAVQAALEHKGPVYVRLGRDEAETVFDKEKKVRIGGSDTLCQGRDVTLIACGIMTAKALEAAKQLRAQGVEARVVNMYSVKPLDEQTVIDAAKETGAIVTVEDHSRIGGLGGAVAEVVVREFPACMEQVAVDDQFGESGAPAELFEKYGLSVAGIVKAAQKAVDRKRERAERKSFYG
jgi:transketolase